MSDKNKDWGHFDIVLGEYLTRNGISKNKIAAAANLQRSQLISYCKNEVQRPDLGVLARICHVSFFLGAAHCSVIRLSTS